MLLVLFETYFVQLKYFSNLGLALVPGALVATCLLLVSRNLSFASSLTASSGALPPRIVCLTALACARPVGDAELATRELRHRTA